MSNPADRPATEPRTEAGKQLAADLVSEDLHEHERIAAIEAEAAQGAAPLDPDARERGQNMQTAIEKGVLQRRESDLAYVGLDAIADDVLSDVPQLRRRLSEGAAPLDEGFCSTCHHGYSAHAELGKACHERLDSHHTCPCSRFVSEGAAPRAEGLDCHCKPERPADWQQRIREQYEGAAPHELGSAIHEAVELGAAGYRFHEWCEHGIRDDGNCSRCPEGAAPRAEGLLRAVVDEVEAEEKRWLEWWARGGKGSFVWKRDAVKAAREALDE